MDGERDATSAPADELRDELDRLRLLQTIGLEFAATLDFASPRLEEAIGRPFERGDAAVRLFGDDDDLEVRIALERAGAPLVRTGQRVALIPDTDRAAAIRVTVTGVAASGRGTDPEGQLETRAPVAAGAPRRDGRRARYRPAHQPARRRGVGRAETRAQRPLAIAGTP